MKIDVAAVRKCLKSFDFQTLFREHLGWDNHQARLDIPVDGDTVCLTAVAQKRGFVAFVCPTILDRPTRLKIDHQVTKTAREHFVIYADQAVGRQVWQWVRREPGKPLASRDHRFDTSQSGDPLIQRLGQIAVSLEEEEDITVVDVAGRARSAFDVDKITKKFYDRFKAEHASFLNLIKGLPPPVKKDGKVEPHPDHRWYTSLMLNRLMFVYFIQKKGFLDGDTDYLGNRLAMVRQARGKDKFQTFYRYFLLHLFHDGLGKSPDERKLDLAMEKLLGKVPFLNGGFFEVHQLEEQNPDIDIPDQAFEKLFTFFDQYRWHLDERPLRADNEINPDVVGYIFEKYINQKQMGAYYTKEDITEYISKNTVIPFLFDAAEKKCPIAFKSGTGGGTGVPPVNHGQDAHATVWQLLRDDPDRYLYPAVKHGVICNDGSIVPESELPDFVRTGMHDPTARMHDKRYNLQQAPAGDPLRLVTETWREYVYRRTRCLDIREKLKKGEIHRINDLVTLNLDIWQFARDAIVTSEGPEMLRAFWQAIAGKIPEKSTEKFEAGITVLDPTCGSGAFLFAALRILETLYSDCLERMARFIEEHDSGPGGYATSRGTAGKSGTGVPPVNHEQDAHATLRIRRGAYLPHWTREGSIYAVTFRLVDSLPKTVLDQWAFERDNIVKTASQLARPLTQDEQRRLNELHSEKVESYLDSGHGACWLKDPRVAETVSSALRHFDGERYDLLAWCVMPNHVHVVIQPRPSCDLANILHSWKSYSAKEANKILGRKGEFWQSEYYDHLIRDEQDLWHSIEYVVSNPERAGLKNGKWVVHHTETCCTERSETIECGTGVPPVKHGQDARATRLRKFSDFRQVLAQIAKHPSERYFILKSIILNNLFGVDIMEEAVEICKLRLFLKLVAQVESVDQIEPLPDMDFNIRAGNTLVGYAMGEQARKAFTHDPSGQMRTMDAKRTAAYLRFKDDLLILDADFRMFRSQQTTHGGKVTREDKQELRRRLQELDAQLDSYLAAEYGISTFKIKSKSTYEEAFAQWKVSHQPFHWFVEFYGIMHSGGFDVIIGNPPYVVYSEKSIGYRMLPNQFQTNATKNLYAFIFERSIDLAQNNSPVGLIVQLTAISSERLPSLQDLLAQRGFFLVVPFPRRPESVFEGVEMPVVILLSLPEPRKTYVSTRVNRFYTEERPAAMETLSMVGHQIRLHGHRIAKYGVPLEISICTKISKPPGIIDSHSISSGNGMMYYQEACRYWLKASDRLPFFTRNGKPMEPPHGRVIQFRTQNVASLVVCLLNSSLFYWYYSAFSDCEHVNDALLRRFKISDTMLAGDWRNLSSTLGKRLDDTAVRKTIKTKEGHTIQYDEMKANLAKPIIDEIDRVLAQHYGFTDEEFDFIINYDIKYRMGRDGGDENEAE